MILKMVEDEIQQGGPSCRVGDLLATLDKAESEELRQALAGKYPASAIGRALAKLGYKLHVSTINRHRRRDCACRQ